MSKIEKTFDYKVDIKGGIINTFFTENEVVNFIIKKRADLEKYDPSKIDGYKKLLRDNKTYPSVRSGKQFQTIIETYTEKGILKYVQRLIGIIQKITGIPNSKIMLEHLVENQDKSDKEHYQMLREMYLKRKNKKQEGGYMSQMDVIFATINNINSKKIRNKKKPTRITSIMDIGCGDGRKLLKIGRKFRVKPSNLICADIDSWFKYSSKKRERLPVTPHKLELTGPIDYPTPLSMIMMVHTIHHWCYDSKEKYIERLSSLSKILAPGGFVVIVEHDIFTQTSGCILDIEHGIYESVLDDGYEEFKSDLQTRYLNFIEVELMMESSGFKLVSFQHYNAGSIISKVVPNRTYISIYQKI